MRHAHDAPDDLAGLLVVLVLVDVLALAVVDAQVLFGEGDGLDRGAGLRLLLGFGSVDPVERSLDRLSGRGHHRDDSTGGSDELLDERSGSSGRPSRW